MIKKSLILLISVLVIVFFLWGTFLPKSFSKEEVIFTIQKGEGSRDIALNLQEAGLIKFSPFFRLYVLFANVSGKLQAGSYTLSPSMNIPQIAEKFSKGDIIKIKVVIPEGYAIKDIAAALKKFLGIEASDVDNFKASDFKEKFSFLEEVPRDASLEGFLFPDTYNFSYQTSAKEAIEMMLANFDKKLTADLKEEIKKQGKSIFDIMIMASLIEKEVNEKQDKELVSGILWKRLKSGMPLQVDATISYITDKKATRISIEETKIDSPYNTYKYKGLPVGPISNPGISSIMAAVYPQNSPYWYYLSTSDGETIFSKTLEEHNLAKIRYLR